MSPSRIPRPSPVTGNRSAPTSPLATPHNNQSFKPNNPFAQSAHRAQSPGPPTHPSPQSRIPQTSSPSGMQVRRRKPPSELDSPPTQHQPIGIGRRPVPTLEEVNGQTRGGGVGIGIGSPNYGGGAGNRNVSNPRSCLRQPSTPSLRTNAHSNTPTQESQKRSRALSSPHTNTNHNIPPPQAPIPAPTMLFEPSFAESREPSVPPHIRVRLRLIHQLGVVLGMDAQGISGKIDVPGLLARVDAAYDRGTGTGMGREREGSVSGLPLPLGAGGGVVGAGVGGQGMVGKGSKSGREGVMGMFKRFGRKGGEEGGGAGGVTSFAGGSSEGPAFGVALNEAPPASWCTSLIGGQRHELPLIVFTVVEEIYRRGMSQPGIFRLAGDGTRISHLTKVFNLPPLYGDSLSISSEPIHNLTGLIKRYVRDLPEPILDESLFPAFLSFCAEPEEGTLTLPLSTRIAAAQILLKLLPPLHFSLFIYLLAFLGQLPLFPDNRLNVESISIIFGPAMCAVRGRGISGLGPGSSSVGGRGGEWEAEEVSNLVNQSQSTLGWLLKNWSAISEKVLDPPFEEGDKDKAGEGEKKEKEKLDPRLLSPIDLRRNPLIEGSPYTKIKTPEITPSKPAPVAPSSPKSSELASNASTDSGKTAYSDTAQSGTPAPISSMPTSASISGSGSGIFARAFSSMNIAGEARNDGETVTKPPKRSASFTSLSSLVRKGGALMRSGKSMEHDAGKRSSNHEAAPTVNPQITNVLGSLHDLLVSKDKQIERDARELALLRHTLLEMDEKLQRAQSTSPSPTSSPYPLTPQTPAITITSTPSTTTIANKDRELSDSQTQLTTALAALETARLQSRKQAERTLDLEAGLARADSERRLDMGKFEVALAVERAKVVSLAEERDIARERLERVKTTLFSVA